MVINHHKDSSVELDKQIVKFCDCGYVIVEFDPKNSPINPYQLN